MKIKLIASVSALAFGLAMSGAAMAQSAGADEGNAAAANGGSIATAFDISALNGNSVDSNNDNSTDVSGLNNNDLSSNDDNSTNTDASTDVSGLNNNDLSTNTDSNNDNSTNTDASTDVSGLNGNALASYNTDNSVEDSGNTEVEDSYNTDNSTTTINVRLNLSEQDLDAEVTNISFGGAGGNGSDDNRRLRTGDISASGNAFQGFGGIHTASNNSGFGSAAQAGTMVSANANVTFQ